MVNVSVIIPCYNAEKTIRETIESVLAQTYQDFEIIVVDDGSTDGSQGIIQSFEDKVRYIYQENKGQASARNTAIRASDGTYLAFLDADDLWMPDKLEKQITIMQQEDIHWCYCDCDYFLDESGKTIGVYSRLVHPPKTGWVVESLLMGNFIASPTPIVSRSIFEKAGYFNECKDVKFGEDWDEWIRIAFKSEICYVNEPLTKYRIHNTNYTRNSDLQQVYQSHEFIISEIYLHNAEQIKLSKNIVLANLAYLISKSAFLRRQYELARQLIQLSINRNPNKHIYKLFRLFYTLPKFFLDGILFARNAINE